MKLDFGDLAGKVAIVGAGPGDPELMTLRAHRLLARADVVLCDRLVNSEILAICPEQARIIDVGKNPDGRATSQEVINHLLSKEARGGAFVVRLKGGDPFVFGRGGEEALHLAAHGILFEVVPGVSSAVGVPGRVGIPVTHRGIATHFTVVAGMGSDGTLPDAWRALGAAGGTIVVLMGVRNLREIAGELRAGGRAGATPAALIQEGTTEREFVVESTLDRIADVAEELGVTSPAVLVVGDVVALRHQLGGVLRSEAFPMLETVG